jgi:GH18 family chitinase
MNIVNIEYEIIHQYVDWINLMTYMMHGPKKFYHGSNFGAPLHASKNDPAP